jgi:hypothetical protein
MKKQVYFLAIISLVGFMFTSCGSSDKGKKSELVELYCTGPEYRTNDDFMRASATGESPDMGMAMDIAMQNARNRLAAQLEVFVSNLSDQYKKQTMLNDNVTAEQRFESLVREVFKNKLNGSHPICEKVTQGEKNGRTMYTAYVAMELGGEELVKQTANKLSADEELKVDYDYEKFKKSYEEAMKQLEAEQH